MSNRCRPDLTPVPPERFREVSLGSLLQMSRVRLVLQLHEELRTACGEKMKYILLMNTMTTVDVYAGGFRLAEHGCPGAHRIHENLD
jgi:hypothetical protein